MLAAYCARLVLALGTYVAAVKKKMEDKNRFVSLSVPFIELVVPDNGWNESHESVAKKLVRGNVKQGNGRGK